MEITRERDRRAHEDRRSVRVNRGEEEAGGNGPYGPAAHAAVGIL